MIDLSVSSRWPRWVITTRALVQLTRLFSSLMAAGAGCAAVYTLNATLPLQTYWITGIVLACMTAASCAINDVYDIEKDRINHPTRPLPAGEFSPKQAQWLALVLFAVAVLASMLLGFCSFTLVTISSVLLWYYSTLLNYSGILGNILVATLIALLMLLSSFVADRPLALVYPAALLFCYALAREILLDIHDAEGDRSQGVYTIANLWSRETAFKVVWMVLAVMVSSMAIANALGLVSRPLWFFGCVSIMVLDFGVMMLRYQRQLSETAYNQFVFWERLGMIFGVMGLLGAAPAL